MSYRGHLVINHMGIMSYIIYHIRMLDACMQCTLYYVEYMNTEYRHTQQCSAYTVLPLTELTIYSKESGITVDLIKKR
jgi:hypothetical protein